jgi:hypothetical protein
VIKSVLEAIRQGKWNFEPVRVCDAEYDSTEALPGSSEKIAILATRARDGLPLWHPNDRQSYDDSEEALI